MATGDLKNNLRKLQSELRLVKYDKDVDYDSLGNGVTAAYLPIYHYMFVDYSHPVAEKIAAMGIEMFGKTDLRFMEAVYKVLREMFSYKPPVTKDQFFAAGFGERKVIMCAQILQQIRTRHQSLAGLTRSASSRARANRTLPCSSSHANSSSTDHDLTNCGNPSDFNASSSSAASDVSSPAIFSRIIGETKNGLPSDLQSTAADAMKQLCSSPDEEKLARMLRDSVAKSSRAIREPAVPNVKVVREPEASAQNVVDVVCEFGAQARGSGFVQEPGMSSVKVVRELAAGTVNGVPETAAANINVQGTTSASSSDAAVAIQSAVLAAVTNISATVQQLGTKLNSLGDRLARLESLERHLTQFTEVDRRPANIDELEHRVVQLEQSVHPSARSAEENLTSRVNSAPMANISSAATGVARSTDVVMSQLENLTARMTLAENKLTLLQAQTPCRVGLFPSPEGTSKKILSENGYGDSSYQASTAVFVNSASAAAETLPNGDDSTPRVESLACSGSDKLQQQQDEKCPSRSEQLERIQAMLRGTKEMLNIDHNDSLS